MLSAILAVAAAAPSGLIASHYESPIAYQSVVAVQPELHHVGAVVQHIPTAVSHQSRTDYHSKPIVKSVLAPVEYVQPVVHHSPAIAYTSPAIISNSAPLLAHSAYAHNAYAHSAYAHHSAPLIHSW